MEPRRPVIPLLDNLFRAQSGRLHAVLARQFGVEQLDRVEDAVHDAIERALRHWPATGIPDHPEAWLLLVARRRMFDMLRQEATLATGTAELLAEAEEPSEPDHESPFADAQLRLMFLCCHPSLSLASRVALTLKVAAGFTVAEIARAFLADDASVAQRLVRAKRTLRDQGAALTDDVEGELPARLDDVLEVLYLLFNEGYASLDGRDLIRDDLCREALRLTELLLTAPPTAEPRVFALAALFAFQSARFSTRVNADGTLIKLEQQDRSRWDSALIARGFRYLDSSAKGNEESAYHAEAEIASCHAIARAWHETNWPRILAGYNRLLRIRPGPVAALNRVIALRMVHGATSALAELAALESPAMERYPIFHTVRGELLAELDRNEEAAASLRRALQLVRSEPFRRQAVSRLEEIEAKDVDFTQSQTSLW